ncbi:hypothetical protein [Deinococcus petrolearius]|uniref:Uncharacterized protein n=1 Tax=Deinococcus petrolearius TaxID=1751295 RepID=A0ABW1DJH2_9DEIO
MISLLAVFALVFYGRVIFSPLGRGPRPLVLAALAVLVTAFLGADWVVHPAAGMLLGYLGSEAFGPRRIRRWPALLVGLVAGLAFMAAGAFWVVFPLVIMAAAWFFTRLLPTLARGGGQDTAPGVLGGGFAGRAALPGETGAETLPRLDEEEGALVEAGGRSRRERREARRERRRQGEAPAASPPPPAGPPDPLAGYLHDTRLPGEARAQLAALNLRTHEALTSLQGLGQQGSEAAYLARAVRDEYAPNAVQAYLKLPPTLAASQPLRDGKTGRDLLREQLDLLLDATQDILARALRAGGDELLTHQRFLEEKFGRGGGDLKI